MTVLGVVLLLTVIAPAVLAGVVVHRLGRRNRVCPRVPSLAPFGWLWSMRSAARLHRRLCRSAATARLCAARRPQWSGLGDVAGELEARAVAVDEHLVWSVRAPGTARRRMLAEVAAEVREVESLTERVLRMVGTPLPVPAADHRAELHDRVDALELALREIAS
jgi:hypothetical protein